MSSVQNKDYGDMINLPHHVSTRHPQMSPLARAAQFSPFAALTGHEDAVRETGRLTEEYRELDEDSRELLDNKIRLLMEILSKETLSMENLSIRPEVEVTYFQPDQKKSGGAYVTVRGRVEKVDAYLGRMVFTDRTDVALNSIRSIEGDLFGDMEGSGI